jgi:hypothetical protein
METLNLIRVKGYEVAEKYDLLNLPESRKILTSDEIVADFVETEIEDLFEFQTLNQFGNSENLFARAFIYTYGKGAEFALSHLLNNPMPRIGYNFDECMKGSISNLIPSEYRNIALNYSDIMLEMYLKMFALTKGSQEKIISEGDNFGKAIFVILNGAFYWGTRIVLSLDFSKELEIDFSPNNDDIKYDYDNYDQKYNESDYQIPII